MEWINLNGMTGMEWMEWNGMEWKRAPVDGSMEWNGMDKWNGMEWTEEVTRPQGWGHCSHNVIGLMQMKLAGIKL